MRGLYMLVVVVGVVAPVVALGSESVDFFLLGSRWVEKAEVVPEETTVGGPAVVVVVRDGRRDAATCKSCPQGFPPSFPHPSLARIAPARMFQNLGCRRRRRTAAVAAAV